MATDKVVTDEEIRAHHLQNARRMAMNATYTLEMYVSDVRRNTDRGEGSGSIARSIGGAVADLAAASAVIELLTDGFK